ncbi:MAG: hypothetical protein ACPGOV_11110 [Magnetovibrionaceae bacterium]
MKVFGRVLILALVTLQLSACFGREQVIYSNVSRSIPASAQSLSLAEISSVIQQTAISRNWIAKPVDDNTIRITHEIRTHMAAAEITFSQDSYKTTYVDSTNLLYKGSTIHRNYNRWVRNLEQDIDIALRRAASLK